MTHTHIRSEHNKTILHTN